MWFCRIIRCISFIVDCVPISLLSDHTEICERNTATAITGYYTQFTIDFLPTTIFLPDTIPNLKTQVRWANAEADLGNILHASQVLEKPDIQWDCDVNNYYALYMFDIDPLGQKNVLLTEGKQWVVGNINNCNLTAGETIADYLPPTPVPGAGDHRYVFILYEQKRRMNFE